VSTVRKKSLAVKQFLAETREMFSLELINGIDEGALPVTVTDIHRPGLALTGFMQNYLNERIQILGETEILYLNTRAEEVRHEAVERLFSVPLVCIIVTRSLDIPRELLEGATRHGVPLLRTSMLTTPFIHQLTASRRPARSTAPWWTYTAWGSCSRAAAGSARARLRWIWSSAVTGWWRTIPSTSPASPRTC